MCSFKDAEFDFKEVYCICMCNICSGTCTIKVVNKTSGLLIYHRVYQVKQSQYVCTCVWVCIF